MLLEREREYIPVSPIESMVVICSINHDVSHLPVYKELKAADQPVWKKDKGGGKKERGEREKGGRGRGRPGRGGGGGRVLVTKVSLTFLINLMASYVYT